MLSDVRSIIDPMNELLTAQPPVAMTDDELLGALREHERVDRVREYERHALVAELHARGLAGPYGCRSTAVFLSHLLRIRHGDARARVEAAENLGPRRNILGEPLEPVYPRAARAQADGAISGAHAKIVIDTVEKLPDTLRADLEDAVEEQLVAAARTLDPRQLALVAERVLTHVDPDGKLENVEERHRRRRFDFQRRADGSGFGSFEADLELAELLATVFAALGKPVPDPDGRHDARTSAQRNHDALRDALQAALRSEALPSTAGVTTTVVIVGTAEQFASGVGLVRTGTGALIPASEANRWASGDSRFLGILADGAATAGARLVSHSLCQRLFSETQRLVLAARDKGCSFPGCTAPPWLCQAHHIRDWGLGGKTAIENGALLCGYHHREFAALGWACVMIRDRPHWVPPKWWDPDQQPLLNTAHDPPG
jgi:hypothetical protein